MSTESQRSLYPFLHGDKKDPDSERAVLLNSVAQKAAASMEVKQDFFANNAEKLLKASVAIADIYRNNGRLYSMGNGGSSCDAAHFCVEFQHPVTAGRPALPATNLCADTAVMTAVGNDVGIAHIFLRQIEAHGSERDGLVGFSTSGNSDNLMKGFRKAKEKGLATIGLAGGNGGEMLASGLVDHCLVVETGSIHRVQETHVTCYHIIWDLVHTLLADQRGKLGAKT